MKTKISFKPIAVLMILLTVTLALLSSTDIKANAGIYGGDGVGVNGGEISWSVNTVSGVLTISGSGEMPNFTEKTKKSPWRSYRAYITTVVIEDGITNIGDYAFYTMQNITEIRVPDSVTSVGAYAFAECTDLISVNIPDSVASIGEKAFDKTQIYYTMSAWENGYVLYVDNALVMTKGVMKGSYTVREGTTVIADGAFAYQEEITAITLPDTVKGIGKEAFYLCSSLTSVNIPYGVKSIGDRTFINCPITEIHIPDTVTEIGASAFGGCSKLTEMIVPDSVTSIGQRAFSGCSSLEKMTLPFAGRIYLDEYGNPSYDPLGYVFGTSQNRDDEIEIDQFRYYSETEGGGTWYRFYFPKNLTEITVTGGTLMRGAFENCSQFKKITLGDGVTGVGNEAFKNCSSLVNITLPDGVTEIGDEAFMNCRSLAGINVPDAVTYIGDKAFWGCLFLGKVSGGAGVTRIGEEAFCGCYMLKEVAIGSKVEFIGKHAFSNCNRIDKIEITDIAAWCGITFESRFSNPLYYGSYLYLNGEILTDLVIPDGIEKINAWAFANCYGLQTVDVPDSVTLISENAFSGCLNLYSVTLGSGVSVIERNAFLDCRSLKTVTFKDPNDWWTEDRTVFGEELSSAERTAELIGQYADRIWYKGNVPPPPPDYTWIANAVGLSSLCAMLLVIAVFVLKKKRA